MFNFRKKAPVSEGQELSKEELERRESAAERLIHLRVKVKSLAAEATIIRQEAARVRGKVGYGLNQHRTTVVRRHARLNLLAYGLLRGVPYATMEARCREEPDFAEVASIARRFGATEAEVRAWRADADAYRKACERAA
jgi:hypothetical protein